MLKTQRWCLSWWVLAVVALTLALVAAPEQAAAAPVPSQAASATAMQADAAALGAERSLLQARLAGFGLTEGAAADRVALLTDEEVHAIVADPGALRVAAGSAGDTAAVAAFALLFLYGIWFMYTNG